MPVDNPRLFVSYSRDDSAFAERLATDLRARGVNIWFDRLDIRTGAHWDMEVEAGLKASEGVLVILSPTSVASQNVMDEVSFAMGDGKRILPVLYQPCAIPLRLARLQYIDLVEGYDEGLARLVADLSAHAAPHPPPIPPPSHAHVSGGGPPRPAAPAAPPAPPAPPVPQATPPSRIAWRVALLVAVAAGALVAVVGLVILVVAFSGGGQGGGSDTPPDDTARVDIDTPVTVPTPSGQVVPRPGMVHPDHPHVIGADEEGRWTTAPGYAWVAPDDPADLRVVWTPGLAHRHHPNVHAGDEEGTWAVAPGYEWTHPEDPADLSVRPLVPAS